MSGSRKTLQLILHRKYVRKRLFFVFFYKKEKKLGQNVGVKGKNVNI